MPASSSVRPASRHAVAFVFVTVLLDMLGFGLIMPVIPRLISDVAGLDLAAASVVSGWMYFAFSGAQFLFAPFMGNLSDAYGRRPLLLLAVFGLGADYLFSALAPSLTWLFVGRALAGLCGSSHVIANAYIADVTPPEERAKAFGLMGGAFGAGFVLGPALGGLLGQYGPRVPFWVAAAVSLLNFAYGAIVLPETLPVEKRRPFEWARANPLGTFRVFGSYSRVLPYSVILFLYFFATAVYPAIWPFWGIAKFGWSPATIGITLAAFGIIATIVQAGLVSPFSKRYGESMGVLVGMIAGIIGGVGYGLAGSLPVVVVLMLVHGLEGFVHPMMTAMLSAAVPDDAQGELQGGISSVMNVAMLAGTVAYSQIFGYFMRPEAAFHSPSVGMFLCAALLLIPLGMFVWLMRTEPSSTIPGQRGA